MLPRTPLAVTETHHYSHGLYSVWLQVYFQDPQGRIRSVNGNEGGKSSVCVDAANLNKEFAAISWGGPETLTPQEVGDSSNTHVGRARPLTQRIRSVFITPIGLVRSLRYA